MRLGCTAAPRPSDWVAATPGPGYSHRVEGHLQDEASQHVRKLLDWIDEAADPLTRLQRADAAYGALATCIREVGSDGRRGQAARELVHAHGLKEAAALAGYSVSTMRRAAWS